MPLQVQCLDSAAAFDQLQSIWQGLERQDTQCTPFNTWMWNSLWWQHYSTAQDHLTLLIARQGNRVVGIAPLYIHVTRMYRLIPVNVLRFIGTGADTSPDYLNIIALPDHRNAAEQAFLAFLPEMDGWHKLHLADMLQSSMLANRVRQFIDMQPGQILEPQSHVIQKAALPATFDDYRSQLSREQINHRQNRLDAAGVSELSICASSDELAEASDALVSLHSLRWESEQEAGAFRSRAYEQFHRAVIRQFFAMDALWLATLKLDDRIIAVQYIFAWRGELMFMQSGYSPEHESLSPEHVLFTYVIQRGVEQGMEGVDMLKGHHFCESVNTGDAVQTIDLGYLRPGVRQWIVSARKRLARI